MGYIDSHAHINDASYLIEFEEMIRRAQKNNVTRILMIICDLEVAAQSLFTASKYECVDVAIGIHPESANETTEKDLGMLEQYLKHPKVIALGEIGLDYYWVNDNKDKQKELFIKQLKMADKYNLPVIIHCRDAYQDTQEILNQHHILKQGILHCYSGSVEMSKEFIKMGYYISLAGPVTFKNAKVPKEVAKEIPLDRLLIETDSPYLTPSPYRGKRNEPSYVKYVAEEIISLRNISEEEFVHQTEKNYNTLFNLSK